MLFFSSLLPVLLFLSIFFKLFDAFKPKKKRFAGNLGDLGDFGDLGYPQLFGAALQLMQISQMSRVIQANARLTSQIVILSAKRWPRIVRRRVKASRRICY